MSVIWGLDFTVVDFIDGQLSVIPLIYYHKHAQVFMNSLCMLQYSMMTFVIKVSWRIAC